MNTFYQSCEASRQAPYDVEKSGEMLGYGIRRNDVTNGSNPYVQDLAAAKASQYYVKCDKKRKLAKGCRDLCGAPPTYIWGGMGFYEKTSRGMTIDLFRNVESTEKLAAHPGLDCSGFIHATLALAGLRARPDMAPSAETADTVTARTFMNQPGGCFKDVSFENLKPGDLIAWRTHIAMVDRVGEDPFGLRNISKVEDCTIENLDPDKFDLVIVNSKGGTDALPQEVKDLDARNPVLKRKLQALDGKTTGVGVGISKLRWADLAVVSPKAAMELPLAACFAKFGREIPKEKSINRKPWRETINIVRHRLADDGVKIAKDDPCLARADESTTLVGFECVRSCPR